MRGPSSYCCVLPSCQCFTNFAIKAIYALWTTTGSSCKSANRKFFMAKSRLVKHDLTNVNSDRGFESWPFTGYETMSSLLPMFPPWGTRTIGHWIIQPPVAYLGDEQMLRILGRGRSVSTVTELIFVRAQCFTSVLRTQIGMFRPIRMDHTNCLQVTIKTLQFN
jgi:hypothetical protein